MNACNITHIIVATKIVSKMVQSNFFITPDQKNFSLVSYVAISNYTSGQLLRTDHKLQCSKKLTEIRGPVSYNVVATLFRHQNKGHSLFWKIRSEKRRVYFILRLGKQNNAYESQKVLWREVSVRNMSTHQYDVTFYTSYHALHNIIQQLLVNLFHSKVSLRRKVLLFVGG